jgi:O-antigen ligase
MDLIATVKAPDKPGSYVMVWDMVHKHTTWFSDKVGLGTPVNVVVDGKVSAGAVRPDELLQTMTGRAWQPGRRELWGIAIGLFLEHPVLGVGPDNFRWVYGAFAGKEVWDTRVFSNSLYLELLSTIGIVGFTAFMLLAVRALTGLLRKARRGAATLEVAAITASLIGFLVHGLVDYLLAFTPIYLAFFVLLGAASAVLREEALL